ncbi:MAG: IS66 family transposase [Bdellovibrio sp.]|nr:IS66 family transposase [Bdellovibrio sp.]
MNQQYLFDPIPVDKFDLLTKEEVIALYRDTENLLKQVVKHNDELQTKLFKEEQKRFTMGEQLINIKNRLFGKSSEKSASKKMTKDKKSPASKRVLLPSDRYPNLDIIEKDVTLEQMPNCPCCESPVVDSGLTEDSEYLTVIPKRYYVVRQRRHKYRCWRCQGAIVTASMIPRVKAGSGFSDEMMIDVAMSKYLELMPIERYASSAKREGVDLAANSLIELTHHLADFVSPVYERIKNDVLNSEVIHADETLHRMLEGDEKSHWFFWGFSNEKSSYFEARDTRSGDVAVDLLKDSKCRYLVSDVFSGYQRAVTETNKIREGPGIENLYCNAHARRKFKEAENNFPEAGFFIRIYKRIYRLQKTELPNNRAWQRLYLGAMKKKALKLEMTVSSKSSLGNAFAYYLKNFAALVRFTTAENLPIDNNAQERQLRSPVVGRKTWYGTHSKRGARTASILFSIVESCKLNGVDPRKYLKDLIYSAHQAQGVFTPRQYAEKTSRNDG